MAEYIEENGLELERAHPFASFGNRDIKNPFSYFPICYAETIEIWLEISLITNSSYPNGPWDVMNTCVGTETVCSSSEPRIYYWIHAERWPRRRGIPKLKSTNNATVDAHLNSTKKQIDEEKVRNARYILVNTLVPARAGHAHTHGEFIDMPLSLNASHEDGYSVINGLFIRLDESKLSLDVLCGLQVSMRFDEVEPPQVDAVPLGALCGISDHNTSTAKGPFAVGWDGATRTCVIPFPLPFRNSATI